MPLNGPTFDSRSYQQILQEAVARIAAHNPEWKNYNDSDPGITLLQLFAFMSESIIYRTNLIPERNRMKFLKLLGMGLRTASVAKGIVQFSAPTAAVLEKDQEVLAGKVPFRTQNGLNVLPLQSKLYYKHPLHDSPESEPVFDLYYQLYQALEQDPENLQLYETRIFSPPKAEAPMPMIRLKDTADGCFWLALLAADGKSPDAIREQIANKALTVGIMPALSDDGCVLYPLGPAATVEQPSLVFEIPTASPESAAQYAALKVNAEYDPLSRPGVLELRLPDAQRLKYPWNDLEPLTAGTGNYPPVLDNTDDADRLVNWIRIRAPTKTNTQASSVQTSVTLNWLGVNAAMVSQQAKVIAEQLPRGTGMPDQIVKLRNVPVIPETLQLSVNGELWQAIDDLQAAASEIPVHSPRFTKLAEQQYQTTPTVSSAAARVYRLDPESGEIYFGNGAHGRRPPQGAPIVANYSYGGGTQGHVGIGELNKFSGGAGIQGLKANNPAPTWGADDQETLAEAERRIPGQIRHNERLVSAADYRDIAWGTPGVDLGRVEVLPLFHPDDIGWHADGMVTLMVIPRDDPHHPETPEPDRLFLENVCTYLEPRRIVTTELHVRGPKYFSIFVSVGIEVIPGRAQAPVVNAVKRALQAFLSPLTGGFSSQGWPLNTAVEAAELAAAVTRVEGVASVRGDLLLCGNDGNQKPFMPMSGLQLPRLAGISVTAGDATPLQNLLGLSEEPAAPGGLRTPVPVIPEIC